MDKDILTYRTTNNTNATSNRTGGDGGLMLSILDPARPSVASEFVLQWGNRKRLRCMKVQVKDEASGPIHRTTVRVDRRVVRAEDESLNQPTTSNHSGYFKRRRTRPASLYAPPPQRSLRYLAVRCEFTIEWIGGSVDCSPFKRVWFQWKLMVIPQAECVSNAPCGRNLTLGTRNSENPSAMRGQSNGGQRVFASPDRGAHDKKGNHGNSNHHPHHNDSNNNNNSRSAASSDTAHDSKKGGGSSSGSGEAAPPPVWPPKFVIALTNKEKEEDFLAIKGSKLPQRPKKRAKFIQRTLNLVSPGAWLCDLTLERYEVREKKICKKRPRGLKAMTNMESDSE